jgi:ribokinase
LRHRYRAMILVFGSLNVDLIIPVEHLPRPGETVLGPGYRLAAGGKGANQALAARRAGSAVHMAGCVGADPMVETALRELKADNVDLSLVKTVVEPTGLAAISIDRNGENQIIVASGANRRTRSEQVPDALLTPETLVLLQMEVPPEENWALVRRAKARGARIMLNVAPAGAVPAEIVHALDWLCVNEIEALQVATGLDLPAGDAVIAAGAIAAKTGTTLILTLGGQGAMAFTGREKIAVPALPVKPVDTVGAGDAFVGGFMAAIDQGKDMGLALRRASVGGALACLIEGAQPSLPRLADIEARLTELRLSAG